MNKHLTQRVLSFCLSLVLTLGMLGGIDHLAAVDEASDGLALQQQAPAATARA